MASGNHIHPRASPSLGPQMIYLHLRVWIPRSLTCPLRHRIVRRTQDPSRTWTSKTPTRIRALVSRISSVRLHFAAKPTSPRMTLVNERRMISSPCLHCLPLVTTITPLPRYILHSCPAHRTSSPTALEPNSPEALRRFAGLRRSIHSVRS